MKQRTLIGWNEYVDLPDWGVRKLTAKVDTGARTSALHVEHIKLLARGRVSFEVVVDRKQRDRHIPVVARISRRARVRSSNGQYDTRYFVKTELRLGDVDKEIEISLVDRGAMTHRMLLGRTALSGDFIVDVKRRHVLDPKRKLKKKKKKTKKKTTAKKTRTKKKLRKTVSRLLGARKAKKHRTQSD